MKQKLLTFLLITALPAVAFAQNNRSPLQKLLLGGNKAVADQTATSAVDPARQFIDSARTMLVEEKFEQAKESLRTAIRIAPMSLESWALYDEAVTADYIARKRREKYSPIIDSDIKPVFSITRIDSYIELDTLYVVGTLQNISDTNRQKIILTAKILDENKRELRRESGTLLIPERGLMPNESSLFEIPFKNFPPGGKSFRVEVTAYE